MSLKSPPPLHGRFLPSRQTHRSGFELPPGLAVLTIGHMRVVEYPVALLAYLDRADFRVWLESFSSRTNTKTAPTGVRRYGSGSSGARSRRIAQRRSLDALPHRRISQYIHGYSRIPLFKHNTTQCCRLPKVGETWGIGPENEPA